MENSNKKFEKIYIETRQSLFWYVRKKVNNLEIAQDITSEVYLKLFNNKEVINKRDLNGVKAWLYTVARNLVIDFYRKKQYKVEKTDIEEEIFELIASEETDNLALEIQDEKKKILIAAMMTISSEEREIINLRYNDELGFSQIAKIIGKEEGAVKMCLYRALEKIKKIAKYEE